MNQILGIIVSPRKLGNSELLVKHIINHIPPPWEAEMLRLTDMKIEPCKACYRCLLPDKDCVLGDDFHLIMDKMKAASAVVIGLPVYILGPHSMYKVLCDRLLASDKFLPYTEGKPCIIVMPYGSPDWEGYSKAASLVLFRMLRMKIVAFWQPFATAPGEVFLNPNNLEYAAQLGKNIFTAPEFQPDERSCSLCGSDLLRLLPDHKVECPICGAQGILDADHKPDFKDTPYYRFSREESAQHFAWLGNMKEEFLLNRSKLKEIQKKFDQPLIDRRRS